MAKKATKKQRETKEYAQEHHTRKRFAERYGSELTHEQYLQLCSYLKKGLHEYADGTLVTVVTKQSNRTTVMSIRARHICSDDIIAVYDRSRQTIATVLPAGVDESSIQWNIFE